MKPNISTLKNHHFLVVSKNQKEFQLWNLQTRECDIDYKGEEALMLIELEGNLVAASTSSKLFIWMISENDFIVFQHPFISAITISNEFVITGDVKNVVTLYNTIKKNHVNLNDPKNQNLDSLEEMSQGTFSVSLIDDNVFCGCSKYIEIWSIKLKDQVHPQKKIKTKGPAVYIHHYHSSDSKYFLLKTKDEISDILLMSDSKSILSGKSSSRSSSPGLKQKSILQSDSFDSTEEHSESSERDSYTDDIDKSWTTKVVGNIRKKFTKKKDDEDLVDVDTYYVGEEKRVSLSPHYYRKTLKIGTSPIRERKTVKERPSSLKPNINYNRYIPESKSPRHSADMDGPVIVLRRPSAKIKQDSLMESDS